MSDSTWELMKFALADMSKSDFLSNEAACAYVEQFMLPANAVISGVRCHETNGKQNSKRSEDI